MKEAGLFLLIMLFIIPMGILTVFLNTLSTFVPPPTEQGVLVIGTAVPNGPGLLVPTPTLDPSNPNILQQIVDVARTWLGVPYLWGGCTPHGIDCSCFVKNVYTAFHINVPRTTVTQLAFDRPVPRSDLRVGDTLFFDNTCTDCGLNPTHEGLYIGGGLMIQAGNPVQISSINTAYWISKFRSAGRPPGL